MRAGIERFFWTVAYLKPVQIWGRFASALKRRFKRVPGLAEIASDAFVQRNAHQKPVCGRVRFCFLSEARDYPIDAVEWDVIPSAGFGGEVPVKLWRYNLHYFDWLNQGELANDKEAAAYLILDWTARCADDSAEPWEPYPTSRRLESWLKWLRGKPPAVSDPAFMALMRRSISAQVRRLEIDREVHIQGNHLLKNFMALVLSTAWLLETRDGDAPGLRKKFAKHAASLAREIGEQILPDGGHYECSPMYHRELLEGVSEVADTVRRFAAGQACGETSSACADLLGVCEGVLPAMRTWLDLLTHPDGRIALFHDSALNAEIYKNSYKDNKRFEAWLAESGYFISRHSGGDYLVLCAHGPSPVHQPGHSHADIGSFELSLHGRRVIVDTGTGSYQNPEIRQLCRSTQAHNVPLVEGSEQSDMWGNFRVGRRACMIRTAHDDGWFELAWRDMNGNEYERRITFGQAAFVVRDRLVTRRSQGTFVSMIHLAPGMHWSSRESVGSLAFEGRPFCRFMTKAVAQQETSMYYPEFGAGQENVRLRLVAGDEDAIEYSVYR